MTVAREKLRQDVLLTERRLRQNEIRPAPAVVPGCQPRTAVLLRRTPEGAESRPQVQRATEVIAADVVVQLGVRRCIDGVHRRQPVNWIESETRHAVVEVHLAPAVVADRRVPVVVECLRWCRSGADQPAAEDVDGVRAAAVDGVRRPVREVLLAGDRSGRRLLLDDRIERVNSADIVYEASTVGGPRFQ